MEKKVGSVASKKDESHESFQKQEDRLFSAIESKSMTFTKVFRQYEIIRRDQFTSHWDFKVSILGTMISFVNVFIFPGFAHHVNSGLIIIPYIVWTLLISLPLVNLEMFLGQLSNVGIGRTMGLMIPAFAGLGWSMVILAFYKSLQTGMLMSYTLYYLYMSFDQHLSWSLCGNAWNTLDCCDHDNCSEFAYPQSPTQEFFFRNVMESRQFNVTERNTVSVKMVGSQLATWIIVFCCLALGLKVTSKIVYVTAILPFIGLLTLFGHVMSLDGSLQGIKIFFGNPKVLGDFYTWALALLLSVWTYNFGLGVWTCMSSYNPFHNNCQRDALILAAVDIFTCLLSGITIFGGANHLAVSRNIPFQYISNSSYALSYVVFPELLSQMRGSTFVAIIFFICQVGLILDGFLWGLEVILTEISDVYQPCRVGRNRIIMVALLCITCFGLSIGFCLKGSGIIIILSLDKHTNYWCLITLVFMEVFAVIYIYGHKKFATDISLILGYKPYLYYRLTWQITAPIATIVLSVLLTVSPPTEFRGTNFPELSEKFGWLLSSPPLICILAFAAYRFIKNRLKRKPVYAAVLPRKRWCPRKRANLATQKAQIFAAEQGLMDEFYTVGSVAQDASVKGGKVSSIAKLKSYISARLPSGKSNLAPGDNSVAVNKDVADKKSLKTAKSLNTGPIAKSKEVVKSNKTAKSKN